ncbi:MAG: hypothetical protein ACU0CA_11225 [Paracoccaceae bacterium]
MFFLYAAVTPARQNNENTIVVSSALQDNIAARFKSTRQRLPTDSEMENLIQNHLREEVLYRQAVALGFNNNDIVVRGRMRQKMEFVADSAARLIEPELEELQAILDADPEKYSTPGQITFRQVYLGDQTDSGLVTSIKEQLDEIGLAEDFVEIGVRTLLPHEMEAATIRNIGSVFGPNFATAVEELETDVWSGPLVSAYGGHFVYVINKTASAPLMVEDVQNTLVNEWRFAKSQELKDKQFQDLLAKYEVIIETGDPK